MGAERRDGDNLDGGYVVFQNSGFGILDLFSWIVGDDADHTYTILD